VEGEIPVKNLFNVELNANPLQPDQAELTISLEKLLDDEIYGKIEESNIFLSESSSTKFNPTKLQIISHDHFKITPIQPLKYPINTDGDISIFNFTLQLVKGSLPKEILEAMFRLIFSVTIEDRNSQKIKLSFQCPIDLEELFKFPSQKEDLSVSFSLNQSSTVLFSQFFLFVEIINRTEQDLILSIFVLESNIMDTLMRDEDVRGYVPGDVLLQYYQRYQTSLVPFYTLKNSFSDVELARKSCIKLSFPFIASRIGVNWLPIVRIFNHASNKALDFRQIIQMKVVEGNLIKE
jgi:hypothetical protein